MKMKTDKSDFQEVRHLFIKTRDVDPKNPNIIWATVSTNEVDRYDEIVQPDAFKESLGPFIDNPVVLPAHLHRLSDGSPPVIGNVLTETITFAKSKVDMAIEFDDDELGQKYARKYRKKVMRAFSIGFKGLEGKYEESDGKRIWIWTKIELLEVSAVAVPANRGALLVAAGYYEHDLMDTDMAAVKELLSGYSANIEKLVLDLKSKVESELDEIKSLLIADSDGFAKGLLGDSSESSVPAGDKKQSERYVKAVENVTKQINTERNNSHGRA
jgi:HK97 family phage prohead protease